MKSFRDIRVIPVVLVAIFGLAVLKIAGLVIDGGYVFDYQVSQPAKRSWAQDNFGYPNGTRVDTARHHRFGQEGRKEGRAEAGSRRRAAEA